MISAIPKLSEINKLAPGSGGLKLGLSAQTDLTKTFLGAGLEYQHRIKDNISAFSQVSAGALKAGNQWKPDISASAGVQIKF